MLLVFERLDFLIDVLGERVERGHPLLGGLADLLQFRKGAKLHFHLLHDLSSGSCLLLARPRKVAQPPKLAGQLRRLAPDLIELLADDVSFLARGADVGLRALQCLAQRAKALLILLQGLQAASSGQRLLGKGFDGLPVATELAVWRR